MKAKPVASQTETKTHKVRTGPQGRVVIPAEVRQALGTKPGDELFIQTEQGRLVLETRDGLWSRIRARFAGLPNDVSLVNELIAERRAEAAREDRELREERA